MHGCNSQAVFKKPKVGKKVTSSGPRGGSDAVRPVKTVHKQIKHTTAMADIPTQRKNASNLEKYNSPIKLFLSFIENVLI